MVPLKFESHSWRGVLDTTLCDKACQFSLVSFTNKTDAHYITEILLKVALNTTTLTPFVKYLDIYQLNKEQRHGTLTRV